MTDSNQQNLMEGSEQALYLKSQYTGEAKLPNLDESGSLHVQKILESKANSVLDLGCGAGGILLELQKAGVKELHGIDASPEAIELMKKRFEKFGTLEDVFFTVGNIVKFNAPTVDAVSSHNVLHCFPDAEGIIKKAIESKPKIIVLTYVQGKFITKLFSKVMNTLIWVYSRFGKFMRRKKVYIHSSTKINNLLTENGYILTFNKGYTATHTFVYELQDQ